MNNSKDWIGRSISLEKLKVNYFTGTVKLIDFKLYEADDSTVFVGFDTLIIDTEPYRFISNDIVIEQLYLKGLTTHVVMYDSSFNFDDLLAYHQSEASTVVSDTSASEPLKFELSDFELRGAYFTLTDASIDKQLELSNLDFFVPYLSWDQEHASEAGLKFDFKNGGYFQSKIDIDPKGGEFASELILKDFDISGYHDFVAKYIDMGPFVGTTDLDMRLVGNINEPAATTASGAFLLKDFELKDDEKTIIGMKNLHVRLAEANPASNRFVIDTIQLREPYLYFEMYDSTNNIVELINGLLPTADSLDTDVQPDTSSENSIPELYYALNHFLIDQGIIDIVDKRTDEPFKYHLSELQLHTDSISSTSLWVESNSSMLLNNRGKLIAEVGVNPSNPMDLSIEYTITDFMLADLNIYSRFYMGFPILYGDMYYKAHTEILDGQITSENKLIIHNVELGNKGRGLYDLPIKFALFLLKDKDGVITLDVPVRGDLKDPKVSVGKIVWNTFKNLIIKAAAAPVKLLSGLIGADPADIERIEYDYLDTVFTEKRQKQLDLLLQLEQQKPDLEIELVYFNDPSLERREIAIAEVGKMYEKGHGNRNYKTDDEDFAEFVQKKIGADSIDMENACMSITDPILLDSIALEFENRRTYDLRRYLASKNDSTQIAVIRSGSDAPKNLGSKPIFEVKYGMKEENLKNE